MRQLGTPTSLLFNDMGEEETSSLAPCHPWQAGGLVPKSSKLESRPYLSPAVALGRVNPVPCLGSTVKLALDMGFQVSQAWGYECGRRGHACCLLCSGNGEGEIPLLFLLP